jgi:hypothetical protein
MGRAFRCAQPMLLCVGMLMLMLLMIVPALRAQDESPIPAQFAPQYGIPEDWSTQRVIYTRNGSIEDMMQVRGDPRFLNSFLLHDMREHPNRTLPAASQMASQAISEDRKEFSSDPDILHRLPISVPPLGNRRSKVDWAVSLGPAYGMAIGETPAKYSLNPSAPPSCSDFIVFSLKAAPGVGSQANLVGLTNLYSGTSPTGLCGTAPTFLFSYAIGSGRSFLSPVLSLDGAKVAWVETNSANHAILHITTWVAGQGTNATTGAVAVGSCSVVGSCDIAIDYTSSAFSGCSASPNSNTNSEIYVDYSTDTAFVGADNGILYHVTGIFKGTPTVNFCIPVNTTAGVAMSGPVYDSLLNPPEVFIADSKVLYAYTVGASSFTLKASHTYGNGTLTGPGPVLDPFNNFIYVFSAQDVAIPTNHTSMTQLPTSLASAVVVPLGPTNTNTYPILFYGAFDNNYFKYGPAYGTNPPSTLYSCGTDSTTTTAQDLFAISFNSSTGLAKTTPVMPANTHVNPGGLNGTCSPITEFYDGTTDRIFVGMGEHLLPTGANVVQMWNVTTQLTSAATMPTATTAATYLGGASGLIIDNNASGTAQAESVYFTTLAVNGTNPGTCGPNNYCAVKLTQSLLK